MGVFVEPPFWALGSRRYVAPHPVSVIVTPPAVEPLTLAQAKLRAGLDWLEGDPRDELITGFLATARLKVERDTETALLTQTRDIYFDAWPSGARPLTLPVRPVTAITSVAYLDAAGVTQTVSPANYQLDPGTIALSQARIGLTVAAGSWPTDLQPFRPIVIRVVCGLANVAALQAQAPDLIDAIGLLVAHAATAGRDRFLEALTRDEYDEKIAAYVPVAVV